MYSNFKINNQKDFKESNTQKKMEIAQQIISKNNSILSQLNEDNKKLVIKNVEDFLKKEIEYELFEQGFVNFTNKLDNYTTDLHEKIYNEIKFITRNEFKLSIDLIKNDFKKELKPKIENDLIKELKPKIENTLKNEMSHNIMKELREELKIDVENQLRNELRSEIELKMKEEMKQKPAINQNNISSNSNDVAKNMNSHLLKNLITHKLVNK